MLTESREPGRAARSLEKCALAARRHPSKAAKRHPKNVGTLRNREKSLRPLNPLRVAAQAHPKMRADQECVIDPG